MGTAFRAQAQHWPCSKVTELTPQEWACSPTVKAWWVTPDASAESSKAGCEQTTSGDNCQLLSTQFDPPITYCESADQKKTRYACINMDGVPPRLKTWPLDVPADKIPLRSTSQALPHFLNKPSFPTEI